VIDDVRLQVAFAGHNRISDIGDAVKPPEEPAITLFTVPLAGWVMLIQYQPP